MNATNRSHDLPDSTRRAMRDSARERQRAFIRGLLASHPGITLSDIAARADVSRSTITRFMNDPAVTTVLSGPIMEAIELAFGVSTEPVSGMSEPEVRPLAITDEEAAGLDPNRHRWQLSQSFPGLPGYRAGDFLLADMAQAPRDGDDVLVQIENMRGGAATYLRQFRKNWVFGGTGTDPEFVDGVRVRIAATIIKSWRERDG